MWDASDPDRNPDGTFKVGCSQAITKQTAKELQRRSVISRRANKVTKTRDVLLKEVQAIASPDDNIETWEDAWAFMAGVLVSRGTHLDAKLADAVKVFNAIGKAVDAFPDKVRMTVQGEGGVLTGSPEEVYHLLMQAKENKEREEAEENG